MNNTSWNNFNDAQRIEIITSYKERQVTFTKQVSNMSSLLFNWLFILNSGGLIGVVTIFASSEYVHTITSDNGSEFARHEEISLELKADFFFAHPYSSWERGLNENTNGLVRQYLKKGSEFNAVTDHDLAIIVHKLNNRPRKTLGYKSPSEIFNR